MSIKRIIESLVRKLLMPDSDKCRNVKANELQQCSDACDMRQFNTELKNVYGSAHDTSVPRKAVIVGY